jgi:hypothetical protein
MRIVAACILALCALSLVPKEAKAATYALTQDGTYHLAGYSTPTSGSFTVVWQAYPNFDHSDFAVASLSVAVNGAAFTIYDNLGTCPAPYCGPSSTVTDNVYGTHLGPGGMSTFAITSANLDITAIAAINMFYDSGDQNPDPIGPFGSYQIFVTLPDNIILNPIPGALPLFASGLAALALLHRRRSRRSHG